jgi:hypothetical protein
VSPPTQATERYSLDDAAAGWPLGGLGPQRDVYFPYAQRPNPSLTMALRIAGESGALNPKLTEAVRDAVAELDGELPLSDVAMLDARLAAQERAPAMLARLLGGFAAFSLLLAALGVYGVVAQSVDRVQGDQRADRARRAQARSSGGSSPGVRRSRRSCSPSARSARSWSGG